MGSDLLQQHSAARPLPALQERSDRIKSKRSKYEAIVMLRIAARGRYSDDGEDGEDVEEEVGGVAAVEFDGSSKRNVSLNNSVYKKE